MKYRTSPTMKPPPHWYGNLYERSSDPWHRDAFPPELADAAPNQSKERGKGWMALDAIGNPIGYFPDGSEVDASPTQMLAMDAEQRETLMQIGADEAERMGIYGKPAPVEGGGE